MKVLIVAACLLINQALAITWDEDRESRVRVKGNRNESEVGIGGISSEIEPGRWQGNASVIIHEKWENASDIIGGWQRNVSESVREMYGNASDIIGGWQRNVSESVREMYGNASDIVGGWQRNVSESVHEMWGNVSDSESWWGDGGESAGSWLRNGSESQGSWGDGNKPLYCGHRDCPEFTVLQTRQDYELRNYVPVVFVTTQMTTFQSWSNSTTFNTTFMKLFRYINGNNEGGVKIPMTVPVLESYTINGSAMSLMIPKNLASNPPTPNDKDLKIMTSPSGSVYVRSFGGQPHGVLGKNYFKDNLDALKVSLRRDNQQYDDARFYTATYNGPNTKSKRHNEVWLVKK